VGVVNCAIYQNVQAIIVIATLLQSDRMGPRNEILLQILRTVVDFKRPMEEWK